VSKGNELETKKAAHKEIRESKETQTSILQTKEMEIQTDIPQPNPVDELDLNTKQINRTIPTKSFENPLISEASEYIKKYENLDESQRSLQTNASSKKKPTQV